MGASLVMISVCCPGLAVLTAETGAGPPTVRFDCDTSSTMILVRPEAPLPSGASRRSIVTRTDGVPGETVPSVLAAGDMPTVRPAPVVSLTVTRVVVTPGWGEAVRVVTWVVCVRDGDDVPARMFRVDALDGAACAVIEVHETLAAGRGFVDLSKPVAADRTAGEERRAIQALPLTEMLLGERVDVRHVGRFGKTRGPDRVRSLMRALQIACIPDRVARQDFSDRLEHDTIAGVAAQILLTVDTAVIFADRRMANPPPSRRNHPRPVWIGHHQSPSILFVVAVRQSTHRLK